MGLKPNILTVYLNHTVMEHESPLMCESAMHLKEDSTFPTGSPLLGEGSEKRIYNSNGQGHNGFRMHPEKHVPATLPLQVEINGFKQSPFSECLSPNAETNSLSSGSLQMYGTDRNGSAPLSRPSQLEGSQSAAHAHIGARFALQPNGSPSTRGLKSALYTPGDPSPSSPSFGGHRKDIEVAKRRTVAEKVARWKDQHSLSFLVPQCEQLTPTQLAIMARRMRDGLPSILKKYVFEEEEPARKILRQDAKNGEYDEETDVSDIEMEPCRVDIAKVRWCETKVRHGGAQAKLNAELENKYSQLEYLKKELGAVDQEAESSRLTFQFSEESSARCTPLMSWKARRILRHKFPDCNANAVDYSLMKPSTSSCHRSWTDARFNPKLSLPEANPIERRMQSYGHSLSLVPSVTIRKRTDKAVWLNTTEMNEERQRNGWNRFAVKEQRRLREEGRSFDNKSGNESSDYEDTDQSDDEYVPKTQSVSKYRSGSERRRRGRPPKGREGKDPPLPLTKIGRRSSVASSSRSRHYELDEYVPDIGTAHLPQKVDYKEIAIPSWHSLATAELHQLESTGCETCACCNFDLILSIAQKHHIQEYEERRRFQAYRDKAARDKAEREHSVIGSDPPSGQHTPQPVASLPLFEQQSLSCPSLIQKSSSAKPYSPRQFIV